MFSNPSGPAQKPNGDPTRLALSAAAWGEPVPKTRGAMLRLAAKGRAAAPLRGDARGVTYAGSRALCAAMRSLSRRPNASALRRSIAASAVPESFAASRSEFISSIVASTSGGESDGATYLYSMPRP